MQRSMFLKTSVFCLLGLVGTAYAQDKVETQNENIFSLGEIVVADTTSVQDIAIHNTVTAEEIEQLGATTAAEALKFVPGVNVVQTPKGEAKVNIQGFEQSDILVLIDGVPYYEAKAGSLDLNQIPSSIIGKIVVTKGASSVLYGPNALGGVINIVTKKGVEGFSGTVQAEGGGGGYGRTLASINYGAENGFSVLATADYKRRDSLRFSDDYEPVAAKVKGDSTSTLPSTRVIDYGGKKDNSDLESLNLWTRLGYAPTDEAEVYASVYRFDMERGRPFSDTGNKVKNASKYEFSTFGRYDSYEDMGVDLGGKVQANDWLTFRALAFYHWHEDQYSSYQDETLADKIATSTWQDDSYGGSLFSDMDLDQWGNLSLTMQYKEDKHRDRKSETSAYGNSKSNTFTLAAEDTITFGQFTGVVGIGWHRFEVEEIENLDQGYTEDTFDPMIGLTWTGESGLRIFGSVAKKTRFPSFSDMENESIYALLDPQKNINYTLGAEYFFFDVTNVVVSGFYNDVEDLFGEDSTTEAPINIGNAEFYGVELTTSTDIGDRWNLGLDYTYTHARNTSDDRESDYIEDVPEHIIGASVGYQIPVIEAAANLRGLWRIDNYIQADSKGDVSEDSLVFDLSVIKKLDNGVTLAGYLNNILDADYYDSDGIASNGFSFKFVASYDF